MESLKALLVLVLLSSLGLVACGGGSGSTPPPSNPVATTYHYYSGVPSASSAVGGLISVSSASPAAPATVDTNALTTAFPATSPSTRNATVNTGTMDGATGDISNFHPYAVVFAASGRLWKQYADRAPAPVQISNVTTISAGLGDGLPGSSANDLCAVNTMMADFANPENSVVIYSLAGANSICGDGDDAYSWLRLSTNASTAPVALTVQPVTPVFSSTGAITHIVVIDGSGALVKLDANFGGVPTAISGGAGSFTGGEWLGHLSPTRMLLLLDNGTTGELRIVDVGTNAVTGVLGTITNVAAWLDTYAYDSSYFYFVGNDAGGTPAGVIQRFPVSGVAAAVTFQNAGAEIIYLYLTPNSVVYQIGDTIGNVIASAAKAGGTPVSLASSAAGEFLLLYGVSSTGYVYFDRYSIATPSARRAEAKKDDGITGAVIFGMPNGAEWSSLHYPTTLNTFSAPSYLEQLVVAEYSAAATNMAGATLSVVNPVTAAKNGTVVGTVPAGIQSLYGAGFGTRALWLAIDGDNEIFYVDTAVAGSLTRVTTNAVGEQPVY